MRKKTEKNIPVLEVPHPYCDWEGLKDLFARDETGDMLADIFNACYGVSSASGNYELLENTPYLTFSEARKLVTCIFSNIVACSITETLTDIAAETEIDYSYLSKYKLSGSVDTPFYWKELENGEKRLEVNSKVRPFSLPYSQLPAFCAKVTHTSCHELMFGEKRPIILPRIMREVAAILEKASKKTLASLINEGLKLREQAMQQHLETGDLIPNNEGSSDYGQYRPEHIVVRERIMELVHDLVDSERCNYIFFKNEGHAPRNFRSSWLATMRGALVCYQAEGREISPEDNQYLPNLEMAMFWALATRLDPYLPEKNLDYFICNDYIQIPGGATPYVVLGRRSQIMTYGEEGDLVEITDTDILKVLSFCIALPEDLKGDYMGKIFALAKK